MKSQIKSLVFLIASLQVVGAIPAGSNWPFGTDLEREQQPIARSQSFNGLSFNQQVDGGRIRSISRHQGRLPARPFEELRQINLFNCIEPTRRLYAEFARQYNRTYDDSSDEAERLQLFAVSLKRAIVLNRVIQDAIMNSSNEAARNYYFIEPLEDQNLALWYSDLTDCELAFLKNALLDAIQFVDENKHQVALRKIQEQSKFDLPGLLTGDGWEQMANILLVRLFDRFRADDTINKLFEWPSYFKRLAAMAYSQRQAQAPDFKSRLALISFAYPTYFRDLKYNYLAVNRTNDNLLMNEAHEKFNNEHRRRVANLKVLNKRLSIFRQRVTMLNALNDKLGADLNDSLRHLAPDWLQFSPTYQEANEQSGSSARLTSQEVEQFSTRKPPYRLTQFSDLSDAEFQAFLSNDYSVLLGNKESIEYLEQNFHIEPLDDRFRREVALELELRRGMSINHETLELIGRSGHLQQQQPVEVSRGTPMRPSLRLALQIVDELISDVGLPMGPVEVKDITESEQLQAFQEVANYYKKSYMYESARDSSGLGQVEQLNERQLRLERFKENYGRFLSWFRKEGWPVDERKVSMLRLADMSWLDIKFTMFKLCCLTSENLQQLAASNATLRYLSDNYALLCGSAEPGETFVTFGQEPSVRILQQQQLQPQQPNEMADFEIYYYYQVHFNKHSGGDFQRRFAIFRKNIEAIRRHSCKRSLTLFESLEKSRTNLLNSVDLLDPRRSFTDDLNLDRFEYFQLPRLDQTTIPFNSNRQNAASQKLAHNQQTDSSRSAISYRTRLQNQDRDFYRVDPQRVDYSAKYYNLLENVTEARRRYRENHVDRIYNLVVSRYKWCKSIEGIDLSSRVVRQQCQANGPLGDQALQVGSNTLLPLAELVSAPLKQQDHCANLYRHGLDAWDKNLIKQDPFSARQIQAAKCSAAPNQFVP